MAKNTNTTQGEKKSIRWQAYKQKAGHDHNIQEMTQRYTFIYSYTYKTAGQLKSVLKKCGTR
jgi:hypothetical protein